MNWWVYIIKSSDNSYYTGITTNIERRYKQHSERKGAKFFYSRIPAKVVYKEDGHSRSSATKREIEIKRLTRKEKEILINTAHEYYLI